MELVTDQRAKALWALEGGRGLPNPGLRFALLSFPWAIELRPFGAKSGSSR